MSVAKSNSVTIIDDDAAVRSALKFALEQEGYKVSLFANAQALLDDAALPDRTCLIIDYIMPGMNGLDLLEALRSRGCRMPAILISPSISRTMRQRGASAGVHRFLEKPLLDGAFLEAIRTALGSGGPSA